MEVKKELFYTRDHEWVKIEGNQATIGISDYAQYALGDITFVELPDVAKDIKQQETLSTIESVKAASDIYAPLSGKVIKINEALNVTPELINTSTYNEGWIAVIELDEPSEKENLMDAASYEGYLKTLE